MHGTFVTKAGKFKRDAECSVHHVPLINEPIVGTLIYKVGDPTPLAFPAYGQRCPKCYPTLERMMRMCLKSFVQSLVAADRRAIFRVEKLVVLWKDGRKEEYKILE